MSSNDVQTLTPAMLLQEFRNTTGDFGWIRGYKALDKYRKVENKKEYLDPTIDFLKKERIDTIRSWGTTVLESMEGEEAKKAFDFLAKFVVSFSQEGKKIYVHTRFFALKAMQNLPKTNDQKKVLSDLIEKLADENEEIFVRAGANILIAIDPERSEEQKGLALEKIKLMLSDKGQTRFWPALRALRVLKEFPIESLVEDIVSVRKNAAYSDLKRYAILALGGMKSREQALIAVREVGLVLRTNQDPALRLAAVQSLRRLSIDETQADLIEALDDENAEVRVQAADALRELLGDNAPRVIIQYMLKGKLEPQKLTHLIEALRCVDPTRAISTETLAKELDSEDKVRAQQADNILIELGGWQAVQRFNQRRKTLEALRSNLKDSEDAVTEAFNATMRQANRNFYFAMGVNVIIVCVGISLIILALVHLIQNPTQLESWVIGGGSGVFGVIVGYYFNNSRQNGREDLAHLVNVSVVFQGFLRRIKDIDAAFEKSYMESQFKMEDMKIAVNEINEAVNTTQNQITKMLGSKKERETSTSKSQDFNPKTR